MRNFLATVALPGVLAVVGGVALALWIRVGPGVELQARVPGLDGAPALQKPSEASRPTPGQPVPGEGRPSKVTDRWPWFRGEHYDAQAHDSVHLARQWPIGGPKKLWTVSMAEGYASAAVGDGRVFVLDYNQAPAGDLMRCLSLDDGREIWRNGYRVEIAPNHGITRTVSAVADNYVISLGPKCHAVCWDTATGQPLWLIDLVLDYGTKVPDWYAGQCPLIDPKLDQLMLAPGGKALLIAVDYKTGKVKWESANPRGWQMTHSSIMPMEFGGRRMYVYCGSGGVAGVAAETGEILWDTSAWQIPSATCPSPVPIGDGRIFLCGGYESGAMMLRVETSGDKFEAKTVYRLTPARFSSEQQTPVLYNGNLYGVRQKDKRLVCLDLDGKEVWNSGRDKFGAAPYMIADGLILALNDTGTLTMLEASPQSGYKPLARSEIFEEGIDAWGPMALVAGRLIVRDMTRMACLDIADHSSDAAAKGTGTFFGLYGGNSRDALLGRKMSQSPSREEGP